MKPSEHQDFVTALEAAAPCVSQQDLADRLGVHVQRIRQAKLAPSNSGHRPPPDEWRRALASLIRARSATLADLADQLDPPA